MLIKNSQTNGSAWVYVHMKFKNKLNVTECGCLWKQGRELIKKGLDGIYGVLEVVYILFCMVVTRNYTIFKTH